MIALVQQLPDRLRVVHGGVCDGEGLDNLAGRIDLHVVLVSKIGYMVLLRPTGVQVLLALAAWLAGDAFGHLAALDLRVLIAAVALLGSFDKTDVDDLAATGDQALSAQLFVEQLEHRNHPLRAEALLKGPDRGVVSSPIARTQPHKTQETEAGQNLECLRFA